jgi:large subunit ribosomal protein L17
MFRNQLTALFTHERITTTISKAKELRPMAERMVTLARTGTLANRRRILTMVSDKEVVRHLFDDIAPRFVDRNGGYTRILRIGPRHGDNAEMAIIEFVDYQPKEKGDDHGGGSKTSLMDRAKGLFGGGRGDGDVAETAPAEEAATETVEEVVEETAAETEVVEDVVEVETADTEVEAPEAEEAAEETEKKE